MVARAALPSVVIVGRPNVGKSTLFNALTGQRRALVGDEPGMTRDRIYGEADYFGRRFDLIDTGGIVVNDAEMIPSQILKQARVALKQATHIIYLIDGRTEITGADRDLAKMLHKLGKPVTLVVNKIDTPKSDRLTDDFYALSFQDVFPISAEHRVGFDELLEHVTKDFEVTPEAEESTAQRIKVAIIGRPNVGKSTLLNSLTGQERSIVSEIAGTTRDAVDETVKRDDTEYVFVDTAGIRRKGKTTAMAEKLSVVMARRHIRLANVVLLVVDASEGVVALDATIAGYAHEEGRATIIVANKWDTVKEGKRVWEERIRDEMKFLAYAQIAFISAKTGAGVPQLFRMVREAYQSASKRITTGELNRFIGLVEFDKDLKVHYMTQASVRPPTFIAFTDKGKELHFSTERYLINQLRQRFGFEGTPIEIKVKRR